MARPAKTEYSSYYETYIGKVKGDDTIKVLQSQVLGMQSFISEIPEEKENYAYAPGKWSVKEVMGHIVDTERIMGYRALCIARNDKTSFPGYDENAYVPAGNFGKRSLYDIAHEFSLVRASNIAMAKSFDEDVMMRSGTANNQQVSVRALFYIMAGHELHHINVIRKKYLS